MTLTDEDRFVLGTFESNGSGPFPGVGFDEHGDTTVVALSDLGSLGSDIGRVADAPSVIALFEDWDASFRALLGARRLLRTRTKHSVTRHPLSTLHVCAPIDPPRQILCVGANYRTHVIQMIIAQPSPANEGLSIDERRAAAEALMDERAATGTPYAFSKLPSSVTGPYDPISLPIDIEEPDWELELAVIMSRPARHVARSDVMSYIAGFSIANDVTARERVYRRDVPVLGTDFLAGKSSPTFLPFGPYITPAAFVRDHRALRILLKLNGDIMQDGDTGDMVFDVERQIEYLSNRVQLWPGDLVCTGSPAGNGSHHQRFLQPGDVLEGSITGLGTIRNICVAER